jgi:membrane protein implicated in regulation of membrane protease activity
MDWALYIWLGLMVIFLITEAVCAIHLVSIWFAAGALVAMIAAALGAKLWLQILIFIGVSGALLGCLRPFVKKFMQPKITPTNFDRIVGTSVPVTEDVDNLLGTGAVKAGGTVWSARSESGAPIAKGTVVTVVRIEGVKAIVTPA